VGLLFRLVVPPTEKLPPTAAAPDNDRPPAVKLPAVRLPVNVALVALNVPAFSVVTFITATVPAWLMENFTSLPLFRSSRVPSLVLTEYWEVPALHIMVWYW
jgi:hypothetical protein